MVFVLPYFLGEQWTFLRRMPLSGIRGTLNLIALVFCDNVQVDRSPSWFLQCLSMRKVYEEPLVMTFRIGKAGLVLILAVMTLPFLTVRPAHATDYGVSPIVTTASGGFVSASE